MTLPADFSLETLAMREVPYGGPHYHAAIALRQHVLRSPLGLAYTPAQLEGDAKYRQFVAEHGGQVVGCVMLDALDNDDARLRQFAVAPLFQGSGVGTALLKHFETVAQQENFTRIHLSARETAVRFYAKHNYAPEGEPYVQVGLPHIRMVKTF